MSLRLLAAQLDTLHRIGTNGKNGWPGMDQFTDPAALLEDLMVPPEPDRPKDPALRAAQIQAFIAATGGEEG